MNMEHTPAPWFFYERGFRYRIAAHSEFRRPPDIAETIDSHLDGSDEAAANARRIVAAVNATKDFSVEGLEEIATKGLTLQLALRATWMMETEKLESFDGMKKFLERSGGLITSEDQEADYPLSRGD